MFVHGPQKRKLPRRRDGDPHPRGRRVAEALGALNIVIRMHLCFEEPGPPLRQAPG